MGFANPGLHESGSKFVLQICNPIRANLASQIPWTAEKSARPNSEERGHLQQSQDEMRRESLPFSYSEMSFIMSNPVRRMPRARPRPPSSSEDRGQSVNERHFKNTRPASGFKNPGSTCRRRRRAPPRGSWTNATGLTADRGRPLLVTQIKRGPENHREILR